MLSIELFQFRTWSHLKLDFAPGVTLLKGVSGAGKSTIFEAIAWVLYNKVTQVAPITDDKAKTKVSLTLNECTIERQRNPALLIVRTPTVVMESKEAQAYIDQLFGTYEMWLATSYIEQGERNWFFGASNAEKLKLLNDLSFNQEDPAVYHEKLDTALAMTQQQLNLQSALKNQALQQYTTQFSGVELTQLLAPESLKLREQRQTELAKELQVLRTTAQLRTNQLHQLQQVEQKLAFLGTLPPYQLPTNLQGYTGPEDLLDLVSVKVLLQRSTEQLQASLETERLQQRLTVLEQQLIQSPPRSGDFTEGDLIEALRLEQEQVREEGILRSYQLPVERTAVEAKLTELAQLLQAQPAIRASVERKQLLQRQRELQTPLTIPSLPNFPPREVPVLSNQGQAELESLNLQLATLRQQISLATSSLNCPSCNASLRWQGHNLVVATGRSELASLQQEEQRLTEQQQVLTQQLQLARKQYQAAMDEYQRVTYHEQQALKLAMTQRSQVESQEQLRQQELQRIEIRLAALQEWPVTEGVALTPSAEAQVLQQQQLLRSLRWPVPLTSSQVIRNSLTRQKLEEERTSLHALLADRQLPLPMAGSQLQLWVNSLRQHLQVYEQYLKQVQLQREQRKQLEALRDSLLQELAPDVQESLQRTETELSELTNQLSYQSKLRQASALQAEIDKLTLAENQQSRRLVDLNRLKAKIIAIECACLENTVETLNVVIENVCTQIFDRSIGLDLSLFKEVKSTKSTKQQVNFQIHYQGGTFSNIRQLSGGEADRTSLAFTLALNRFSNFPCLLLDECMISVGATLKEEIVKCIRRSVHDPNRSILVIAPDAVEGIFDNVIEV